MIFKNFINITSFTYIYLNNNNPINFKYLNLSSNFRHFVVTHDSKISIIIFYIFLKIIFYFFIF